MLSAPAGLQDSAAESFPVDRRLPGEGQSLDALARMAAKMLNAATAAVVVCGDGGWRTAGTGPLAISCGRPDAGEMLLDAVAAAEARLVSNDVRLDPLANAGFAITGAPVAALLGVSISTQSATSGALIIADCSPRNWSSAELEAAQDLATLAATALDRDRLSQQNRGLQSAIRRDRASYRRLIDASRTVVFTVDGSGLVTELNRIGAELLGVPEAQARNRSFLEFVAADDTDRARACLIGGPADGALEAEVRIVRPSGEQRLVLIHSVPNSGSGRRSGRQAIARDITEERAREMQLRRAERMASVGPLLSGVCHEINNPLTSIKSFAELLLLDERSDDDREALEIVQREAHRAAKIVSDLRSVAQQGRGSAAERGMVDLNEAVHNVLQLRRHGSHGVDVDVQAVVEPELPAIWATRTQLEEVLHQLLANAEQAIVERGVPGTIIVRTCSIGDEVEVTVEDTGVGIPPEAVGRIFDPFWTTRTAGQGSGLGLTVAQGIVSDHGGTITLHSRPEEGTVVTIRFPIATSAPTTTPASPVDQPTRDPLRVLVVDDEAAIRNSLCRYMERRGHQVSDAQDGTAALALIDGCDEEGDFDVIIADLRMPGIGGFEIGQRLRQRAHPLADRLVLISGDTDLSDLPGAEQVLLANGVPIVQKPFELPEIAQIAESQARMAAM